MGVGIAIGRQRAVSALGDPVVNFLVACDIVARIMVADAIDAAIIA